MPAFNQPQSPLVRQYSLVRCTLSITVQRRRSEYAYDLYVNGRFVRRDPAIAGVIALPVGVETLTVELAAVTSRGISPRTAPYTVTVTNPSCVLTGSRYPVPPLKPSI